VMPVRTAGFPFVGVICSVSHSTRVTTGPP
jgi:hypothetical protein